MVVLSLIFGLATGNIENVSNAAIEGAGSAVELSVSMAGVMCLWSGVMEIMNVCGISQGLSRAFRPILRRLMPQASRDPETLSALSANVSANLLGLGNAGHAAWHPGCPAGCPGTAAAWPVTSCACWWCSTPRPSSCCRPPLPPCGPPPEPPLHWISCRRSGSLRALSVAAGLLAARFFSALGRWRR